MDLTTSLQAHVDLPPGWLARQPEEGDLAALIALCDRAQRALGHATPTDPATIHAEAIGEGSWTRRQAIVETDQGHLAAWAQAHDRAAGRTGTGCVVDPDLDAEVADDLARRLYRRVVEVALDLTVERGRRQSQLDAVVDGADERGQRWLAQAGYTKVRTWLELSRPVTIADATTGPQLQDGVTVRRLQTHSDGLPKARELQAAHRVLEESFQDHFNSYLESTTEFVQRLRESPGHRFDHWWLATIVSDGIELPGGAVVSSVLSPDVHGVEGTYVDYLGVHRRARGRGVAKALLAAVVQDAAERGRNRVDLEVDADSPTHADQLYSSLGWREEYTTQSWHQDVWLEEQ